MAWSVVDSHHPTFSLNRNFTSHVDLTRSVYQQNWLRWWVLFQLVVIVCQVIALGKCSRLNKRFSCIQALNDTPWLTAFGCQSGTHSIISCCSSCWGSGEQVVACHWNVVACCWNKIVTIGLLAHVLVFGVKRKLLIGLLMSLQMCVCAGCMCILR